MVDEMPKHLKQFIMYGEGTTCKFKMAKNRLPSNLFETICVMLNRNGGNIFLGIKDDGEIVGIDNESIRLLRKKFADKFYMEDNLWINVKDVIAKELRSNLLIHREFSNPHPAKLIITKDAIYTENANKSRMIGYMDLSNYTPYSKNQR